MRLRSLSLMLLLGCTLAVALVALVPRLGSLTQPTPAGRPAEAANVILIVADDMRYDGLAVMAKLTALAEQRGVRFSSAYVTTPLCCPSRASILTGQYARHHGVLLNEGPNGGVEAFDDRSTLATWLRAAGVRTGLVGRYLNGYVAHEAPPGWDYWFGTGLEQYSQYYNYRVTDHGVRRQYGDRPEEYSTRVFGQKAIEFLTLDRERPFFLWVGMRAPHAPATPDPLDAGTLDSLALPLSPAQQETDLSDKPLWVQRSAYRNAGGWQDAQRMRRLQLESLLAVDRAIGELVQTLAADGRLARTWIIFTSDNGITLGEHGRPMGKLCTYEECIRVPLVVLPPPGTVAPYVDERLVANIDLAPTIAHILGVEPPATVQGRSLLPLGRDRPGPWRDALLFETWAAGESRELLGVRAASGKYTYYTNSEEEVYDLAQDPYELENLAADPTRAALRAELIAQLRAILDELGPGVAGRSLP